MQFFCTAVIQMKKYIYSEVAQILIYNIIINLKRRRP